MDRYFVVSQDRGWLTIEWSVSALVAETEYDLSN